jgi:predicted dehydrogenase
MFNFGLIGYGRWGKNYAATIQRSSGSRLKSIATRSSIKVCDISCTNNWHDICTDPSIDGVIVASPPSTHFEIAASIIKNRLPVIIEKPVTLSLSQCETLVELSNKFGVFCMVGFTHLYSDAYQSLKLMLGEGFNEKFIMSVGLSNGPFRSDVPVLWDWGSHDIAMCIDLIGAEPENCDIKIDKIFPELKNACTFELDMWFSNGSRANCAFGNISQEKKRKLTVSGDTGSITYDGLNHLLTATDVWSSKLTYPEAPIGEPLENMLNEFIAAVQLDRHEHYSMDLALSVTRTLERLSKKLLENKGGG